MAKRHRSLSFAQVNTGVTPVDVPRIEASIVVDGVLDEPVWARSAILRGFSQYLPVDGRPAEDSTVIHVWYSLWRAQ